MMSIGVRDTLSDEDISKLKLVNLFIWLSSIFCTPYYIGLIYNNQIQLGSIFIIAQLLYFLSFAANHHGYYNTSKILIILTTNYAVLTMNFAFGREGGFLFYYFAAPLVVFTLFHYKQTLYIAIGLLFYSSSYIIGEVAHRNGIQPLLNFNEGIQGWIYLANIFGAYSFLIFLGIGFAKEHYHSYKKLNDQRNELEKLLREKNTLLSETHHRVKNNMAVISGLLDLQMIYNDIPELTQLLNSSKSRIKSMSLVHESLYNQNDVGQIDFKVYISRIVKEIEFSYKTNPNVTIKSSIEPIYFNLQKAVPLGLIINELLTNAFKHAFNDQLNGIIHIELIQNGKYILRISDNGSGLKNETSNSMGLTLIDALVNQLDGKYTINSKEGTTFEMTFD
jgi:two-component sensor histidine kinase